MATFEFLASESQLRFVVHALDALTPRRLDASTLRMEMSPLARSQLILNVASCLATQETIAFPSRAHPPISLGLNTRDFGDVFQ
jgi:hypothetical protein